MKDKNNHNMIIKNVKIYSDLKRLVSILIKDGVIQDIDFKGSENDYKVYDAKGAVMLPGMIDAHTHMRDPGLTQKEDFYTASKACSHGGVTTFIDMPNTIPATTTLEELSKKRKIAESKAFVNFGFHFGTSSLDNTQEVAKVKNVASVKVYLNETTGNLFIEDDELLYSIFKAAPRILSFHAEGTDLMQKCFDMAKKTNKDIYFCHVALESELNLLLKLKQEIKDHQYPFKLYIEVTPHHLSFNTDDLVGDNAKMLQMKPTLKSPKDQQALLEAFKKGLIDTIGTDHAPHLVQEKMGKLTYGVPSVEVALPFLLDCVNKKMITLEDVVHLYSKNPALIFGIKNKGELKSGFDADFVLVDLEKETLINKENIQSKCGWSLFEEKSLKGKVLETWVNGVRVYNHEKEEYSDQYKVKEVYFDQTTT